MSTKEMSKLEKLEDKIKALESQKKELQARVREKERKERTRNLIQIGAIIQSVDNIVFNMPNDAELFKRFLTTTNTGKEFLEAYREYHQQQLQIEVEEEYKKSIVES